MVDMAKIEGKKVPVAQELLFLELKAIGDRMGEISKEAESIGASLNDHLISMAIRSFAERMVRVFQHEHIEDEENFELLLASMRPVFQQARKDFNMMIKGGYASH